MTNDSLSIVTITKDDPTGLGRTLASTADLRRGGAQHIVIDGGADSEATLRIVSENGRNVVIYFHPPDGISNAFNAGLARARNKWVWFLNGGDAVHETLDSSWLTLLLATTRAQVVTGAICYDGELIPRGLPPLSQQWPLLSCWLAHPATIIRREALVGFGGFNTALKIAMDYDLWHRLLKDSTIVDVISVPFARFALGGVSQRPEGRKQVKREEADVLLRNSGELAGHSLRLGWAVSRRLIWALYHWRPHSKEKRNADR